MKRVQFVTALALVCWFVFGAQEASWARQDAPAGTAQQRALPDELKHLGAGTAVTVYLTDGSKIEAVLRELQDDAIVVRPKKGGKPLTIMLADIQRVQTRSSHGHRVTWVVVGVAGGVVALIAAAAATC